MECIYYHTHGNSVLRTHLGQTCHSFRKHAVACVVTRKSNITAAILSHCKYQSFDTKRFVCYSQRLPRKDCSSREPMLPMLTCTVTSINLSSCSCLPTLQASPQNLIMSLLSLSHCMETSNQSIFGVLLYSIKSSRGVFSSRTLTQGCNYYAPRMVSSSRSSWWTTWRSHQTHNVC